MMLNIVSLTESPVTHETRVCKPVISLACRHDNEEIFFIRLTEVGQPTLNTGAAPLVSIQVTYISLVV